MEADKPSALHSQQPEPGDGTGHVNLDQVVPRNTDSEVKAQLEPVELPATTPTPEAAQPDAADTVLPRQQDAQESRTALMSENVPSVKIQQPHPIVTTSIEAAQPEPGACSATITDPSEVPETILPVPLQIGQGDAEMGGVEEAPPIGQGDMPPDSVAAAPSQDHTAPAGPVPGVTTQVAPTIQPDLDSSDEAYAESTTTSYVTSIKSEISKGVLENQRLYPSYGQHQYGMPIDEDELDRMDLQHRKYELLIGDKHFLAPIGPAPQRILDLGTGTGIWALDVADSYPTAQVIGIDIAPIQPKWVASNCQFEIDDMEETWTFKENSFDFIHFRDPLYSIRNWPRLLEQCYSHTKPGGWCELACIYPVPMCDDGTMPPDSGFKVICEKFIEASYLFGTPADCPIRFAKYLRNAGFVDVAEHIFKVPSSPWPKDRRMKQIGALEMANVVAGASAWGLRAFEKAFGWSKERTELALVNFRRDVKNRHHHAYCQYFVVYGRKPPDTQQAKYGL